MATTKKRSSGSATIPKTAIEKVHSTLQDLPEKPKENLSLREAIGELHESITTALNRGYSYEEVVRILSDKNVDITVASLKRYLAAARKEVADSKPRRGRRAAGKRSTTGRTRKARLEQQSEELSSAADIDELASALEEAAEEAPEAKPSGRGRKGQAKTTSTRGGRGRASSTAKTAAKAKTTSRKTTPRSTSTRGRRKQSDATE